MVMATKEGEISQLIFMVETICKYLTREVPYLS